MPALTAPPHLAQGHAGAADQHGLGDDEPEVLGQRDARSMQPEDNNTCTRDSPSRGDKSLAKGARRAGRAESA